MLLCALVWGLPPGAAVTAAILTLSPAPEVTAWPTSTFQHQSAGLIRALGRPRSGGGSELVLAPASQAVSSENPALPEPSGKDWPQAWRAGFLPRTCPAVSSHPHGQVPTLTGAAATPVVSRGFGQATSPQSGRGWVGVLLWVGFLCTEADPRWHPPGARGGLQPECGLGGAPGRRGRWRSRLEGWGPRSDGWGRAWAWACGPVVLLRCCRAAGGRGARVLEAPVLPSRAAVEGQHRRCCRQ